MGLLPSPALPGIVGVDGLLAECLVEIFQRSRFCASKKEPRVHVANDSICVVLVNRLELGLRLQHQTGGYFTASDRGHQLFQVWDLADIGCLIDQAPDMHRKSPAIHIVRLLTEQVEKLCIDHGEQEIESSIRI